MRKLSFILALVLMLSCFSCAFAAEFDMSIVRENTDLYKVSVDNEEDVAFITTNLAVSARAFTHKYESTYRYSSTKFDTLVIDYLKTSARPVFRLWVTYCADDSFLNINGISFLVDGKKYTFSDVADPDWYTQDEKGYAEEMLIKFDMDNIDFLVALEDYMPEELSLEALKAAPVTMILHGREDVTVQLEDGFWLDFIAMKRVLTKTGAIDFLSQTSGSPMKVTTVTAP